MIRHPFPAAIGSRSANRNGRDPHETTGELTVHRVAPVVENLSVVSSARRAKPTSRDGESVGVARRHRNQSAVEVVPRCVERVAVAGDSRVAGERDQVDRAGVQRARRGTDPREEAQRRRSRRLRCSLLRWHRVAMELPWIGGAGLRSAEHCCRNERSGCQHSQPLPSRRIAADVSASRCDLQGVHQGESLRSCG